ncbi:MAG: hypothetical protein COA79_21200 [Planctomycetota bacterium]|nr:MAG: hypothetical protein COA79_21200 [Planctomycetota bacterium]
MPVKLDFRKNGVILWHEGVIVDADLINCQKELMSHEFEEEFQFQLIEGTNIEEFNVSANTMQGLGSSDSEIKNVNKQYAVAVAPNDLIFGMGRIWQAFAEDELFISCLVKTFDEAISWLKENGIEIEK